MNLEDIRVILELIESGKLNSTEKLVLNKLIKIHKEIMNSKEQWYIQK